MSDTTVPPVPAPPAGGPPAVPAPPATPPAAEPQAPAAEVRDPAALLSAYNAEKDKRKAATDEARQLKADFEALKAKVDGKEAEHAAELKSREVETAALAKANERILKAEVRAAAAGKLADPADALQFLDLSKLEVGADGEVDSKAVAAAIDKLITDKPYLAAQGKRFQGSADGGTRNESTKTIDDQIEAARKAGNHVLAIALKQKRSAELASK